MKTNMTANNANLPAIPAKRYFSFAEACTLAGLDEEQVREWQQQEMQVLGKGANTLTRLDVIKLRQLRHGIGDYFARGALDAHGNPVIGADEMRRELNGMLEKIHSALASAPQE